MRCANPRRETSPAPAECCGEAAIANYSCIILAYLTSLTVQVTTVDTLTEHLKKVADIRRYTSIYVEEAIIDWLIIRIGKCSAGRNPIESTDEDIVKDLMFSHTHTLSLCSLSCVLTPRRLTDR